MMNILKTEKGTIMKKKTLCEHSNFRQEVRLTGREEPVWTQRTNRRNERILFS